MGGGPTSSTSSLSDRSSDDAIEVVRRVGSSTEKARLLFTKSKVYLHPTTYKENNVPGWLCIVQLSGSVEYRLAWIPEGMVDAGPDYDTYVLVELDCEATEVSTLVDPPPAPSPNSLAWSLPIRSLYSLVIQAPTLASWYGSVNLYSADDYSPPLPTLFFHDDESRSTVLDMNRRAAALGASGSRVEVLPPSWGGETLVAQLRIYARVVRSQIEPALFLINPSKEDLEVHSTALFSDELLEEIPVPGRRLPGLQLGEGRNSILHRSLADGEYPDEVGAGVDNFTFSVLNSFSRITRGAREVAQSAAQSVLSHPLAKPILKNIPPPIAQYANAPGELTRLQEKAGVAGFDSARIYLAKWARVVAEEGERARRLERVASLGGEGREEDMDVGAFEILSSRYGIIRPKTTRAAGTPIVATEWAAWFDDKGRCLLDEAEAKKRIFQRGLAPETRKKVWPFLLKVFPWTSTKKEREFIRSAHKIQYAGLKAGWQKNEAVLGSDRFSEESHRVEIDCLRTDRTHPMFESASLDPSEPSPPPSLASPHSSSNAHIQATQEILLTYVFAEGGRDYVQGMSDLLSPIYVVAEGDESESYWGFCTIMERMKGNFLRDQSGMQAQLCELQGLIAIMDPLLYAHLEKTASLNLFFCFRWILCSFKRELSFEDTTKLWEILWTDQYGPKFHLFFALAIIEQHRDVIMRYLQEFDEILKYINELSQTLTVDTLLSDAETLYLTFARVVSAVDRRRAEALDLASAEQTRRAGMRRRGDIIELGGPREKETDVGDEIEENVRRLLK